MAKDSHFLRQAFFPGAVSSLLVVILLLNFSLHGGFGTLRKYTDNSKTFLFLPPFGSPPSEVIMQKTKKRKSLADKEDLGQCHLDDNLCTGSRLLLISYLIPLILYSPSNIYIHTHTHICISPLKMSGNFPSPE